MVNTELGTTWRGKNPDVFGFDFVHCLCSLVSWWWCLWYWLYICPDLFVLIAHSIVSLMILVPLGTEKLKVSFKTFYHYVNLARVINYPLFMLDLLKWTSFWPPSFMVYISVINTQIYFHMVNWWHIVATLLIANL